MTEAAVTNTEKQTMSAEAELGFDPEALKAKYIAEKKKRDKNGGLEQYKLTRDHDILKKYLEDPYVEPGFTREPVKHLYDVLIIGGGFTGVQVGACLIQQGYTNICIIEKGGDYGGTWLVAVGLYQECKCLLAVPGIGTDTLGPSAILNPTSTCP